MRFRRGVRLLSCAALSLFLLGGLPACSGQQQEEDELATDQQDGGQDEAAQDEASNEATGEEGGEDQASNEASEQATGQEGSEEGSNETAAEGEGGNQTENDLQEIIQEMNGQQTPTAGEGGEAVDPAAAGTAAAPAPVENSAAAAPAPAPAADPTTPEATALPFQPGGSPAAPGLPELGSKMAYIVQHGDTLAKISAKIYGNGGRWKELATLSGLANPSRIYPGDLVYYTLDESAVAFATAYEQVQKSEEQVQPGDTLATIAARVYGDSNAWRAIWRQNDRIDNPDIIPPGSTVYYVPKGALSAAVKKVRAMMAKLNPTKPAVATVKAKAKKSTNLTTKKLNKANDTFDLTSASKLAKQNGIQLANGQLSLNSFVSTLDNVQLVSMALN